MAGAESKTLKDIQKNKTSQFNKISHNKYNISPEKMEKLSRKSRPLFWKIYKSLSFIYVVSPTLS